MVLPRKSLRVNTIAVIERISRQRTGQRQHLPTLLAFHEVTEADTEVAQRHDHQSRTVLTRAARHAAHALAAVPNLVGLQQLFYLLVVLGLYNRHNLPRVIAVELRRRANGSTCSAVDARMKSLAEAVILIQFIK